jgi:hypothetical protein
MTTSRRQNRTQDALNGLSPRSSDRVAHRHISVTTRCVTTGASGDRPPSLQGVVRLQGSRSNCIHIDCTLSSIQIQKTDENIQIRAYSYLQSKKTPQRTPPPRRRTRASLDPVRNSGTRTIEIPLDPILVTLFQIFTSNPIHLII